MHQYLGVSSRYYQADDVFLHPSPVEFRFPSERRADGGLSPAPIRVPVPQAASIRFSLAISSASIYWNLETDRIASSSSNSDLELWPLFAVPEYLVLCCQPAVLWTETAYRAGQCFSRFRGRPRSQHPDVHVPHSPVVVSLETRERCHQPRQHGYIDM